MSSNIKRRINKNSKSNVAICCSLFCIQNLKGGDLNGEVRNCKRITGK